MLEFLVCVIDGNYLTYHQSLEDEGVNVELTKGM
jgi:hypothetical protein